MQKEIIYVIDLDRTLTDISAVMEAVEVACQKIGVNYAEIEKAKTISEKTGGSFSPLHAIASTGSGNEDKFIQSFIESSNPERLIFQDGKKFVQSLKDSGRTYFILTYAKDSLWQEIKMKAADLSNEPHIITPSPEKGKLIQQWAERDGSYAPPVEGIGKARKLVLIDDKLSAFSDLPGDCQGFWLNRTDIEVPENDLASNISMIKSFEDINI